MAKTILKKNKMGGIGLIGFKIYYIVTAVKTGGTVVGWTDTQINSEE